GRERLGRGSSGRPTLPGARRGPARNRHFDRHAACSAVFASVEHGTTPPPPGDERPAGQAPRGDGEDRGGLHPSGRGLPVEGSTMLLAFVPEWMTEWWFLILMTVILLGLIGLLLFLRNQRPSDDD